MAAVKHPEQILAFNHLKLRLVYLARGTWPCNLRSRHPVNRLILILKNPGEGSLFADSAREYPAWEKTTFLLPAFCNAQVKLGKEVCFLSFHFNLEWFYGDDLLSRLPGICVFREKGLAQRAERIWRNPDPLSAALDCEGFLSAVAGRALSFIPEKERLKQPAGKEYAELFAWLEQKDASAEITVTDLADFMNMRRESFSRKFTRDFRISPKQFLARQLLRKASEMLSNPSQPVREIAKALHFSSEYYFSRFFREHTGMPPGEFRRLHGDKSALTF